MKKQRRESMSEDGDKTAQKPPKRGPGKPFAPGNNANPNGRPKKTACLTSLLVDELKKKPKLKDGQGKANDKTWAQLLAEALPAAAYKALFKGDIKPYTLILERVEGKVTQPISGPGENGAFPFTLTIDKASGDK
jgi:hypothetical protein